MVEVDLHHMMNLFISWCMIIILIIRFGVTCRQTEEDLCWLE